MISIIDASTKFERLSRPIKTILPENVNQQREEFMLGYNKGGLLTNIELNGINYVEYIGYNPRGQRLLISYGNGIMTRYAYDLLSTKLVRVRSEAYQMVDDTYLLDSNLKQDYTYKHDLIGNIIQISNHKAGSGIGGTGTLDQNFKYDALYRLSSASGRETETCTSQNPQALQSYIQNETNTIGYLEEYSYDVMGNILELVKTKTHPTTASRYKRVFTYGSNKNTIQSIENGSGTLLAAFTHNDSGSIESKNGDDYYWSAGDQLAKYTNGSSISESYLYSTSNRVKKVTVKSGLTQVVVYIDGLMEHRYEINNGTKTLEQSIIHIMDGTSRIARVRVGDQFASDFSDKTLYNLENMLGSSTVTVSETKATLSFEEYSPFGETSFGSYSHKRYRYCGKEKDESNLYYYGSRYYMNWSCRFISVDPLASQFTHYSSYEYAGNKPINNSDLDGRQEDDKSGSLWENILDAFRVRTGPPPSELEGNPEAIERYYQSAKVTEKVIEGYNESIHFSLDVMGVAPVAGEVFDAMNALLYLVEGKELDAAMSGISIIPLTGGDLAKPARWAVKYGDEATDATRSASKHGDDVSSATTGATKYADNASDAAKGGDREITEFGELTWDPDTDLLNVSFKVGDDLPSFDFAIEIDKSSVGSKVLKINEIGLWPATEMTMGEFQNQLGKKPILQLRATLIKWAKAQGFERVTGSYSRVDKIGTTKKAGTSKLDIDLSKR